MACEISKDGKYFALISSEGKLKIWNTVANVFEQEFTPDFHLTAPCTCLKFLDSEPSKAPPPRKKKKREEASNSFREFNQRIVLGTSTGLLFVYSITKGDVEYSVNTGTNQPISCLSTNGDDLVYAGIEQDVVICNLQKKNVVSKWRTGTDKISCVLYIPEKDQLFTASRNIKLWDVKTKSEVKAFTGHSSEVTQLHYINPKGGVSDGYLISGSNNDRLLSCWNLSLEIREKSTVASFIMEDIPKKISVCEDFEGTTSMAVTVRSGVVHFYQHTLNGKCKRPIKPRKTIQVVSDTTKRLEGIVPIYITAAFFRDPQTLCIGYGNEIVKMFENIDPVQYKLALIRKDPTTVIVSKENDASKIKTPIVSNDVHYLTPQTSSVKRKQERHLEVPMEKRLENLTVNNVDDSTKVPKADNVAQLLVQGLHSKDKVILRRALLTHDELKIKNTIRRLPMTAVVQLVKELSTWVQAKTQAGRIGCKWLKNIILIHTSILLSNPELAEIFASVLGSIESKMMLQTSLNQLKGRVELLSSQLQGAAEESNKEMSGALLLFDDKDSSDEEDEDIELNPHSDSDNEWIEEDDNNDNEVEEMDEDVDNEMSD